MGSGIKKINLDNLMNDIKIDNIKKSNAQSYNMARTPIDVVGDMVMQGSTPAQQDKIAELVRENRDKVEVSYDSQGNAIVDFRYLDKTTGKRYGVKYTVDKNGIIRKMEKFFRKPIDPDYNQPVHEITEYNSYGDIIKETLEYEDEYGIVNRKEEITYNPNTGDKTYQASYLDGKLSKETFYIFGVKSTEKEYLKDGSYAKKEYDSNGEISSISYYDKNGKSISESEYERKERKQEKEEKESY